MSSLPLTHLLQNPEMFFLTILMLAVVWMLRDEKDRVRVFLVLALILNLFWGYLLTVFMDRADGLLQWKYDYALDRMDGALGASSAAVALFFQGRWSVMLSVVYGSAFPMAIFWVWVNRKHRVQVLARAYVAELATIPILYCLLPGCGPAYAFGKTWTHPPAVMPEAIRLSGAPNAFPSGHLALALIFVLTAKESVWRGVSLIFLAGTALATLTTGEHYVIDLVAGAAFGCFLASAGNLRLRRAVAYLGVTMAWSLAIRFDVNALIAHPGVVRLFAALTVAAAMHAVWTEWRAEGSEVRGIETIRRQAEVSLPAMPST